jgi:Peptidase A4 family
MTPLLGRAAVLGGAAVALVTMTITPASAATGAKSTPVTSLHWAGFTFNVGHVTGIRAHWTEPRVTGKKGSEEFVWIGIGGWNQTENNIIQAGTFAYFPSASTRNEGVWWERIPQNPEAQFPQVLVGPGDHISAAITLLAGKKNRWRMTVDDTTSGAKFALTVKFTSMEAYPSFVVEDPDKGAPGPNGPFFPFPHWRSVTFSSAAVRVRGKWVSIAKLSGALRVNMVRSHKTLATTGAVTSQSAFTVRQK